MAEHKVEHVNGGDVREFSAIKGQGKAGVAPAKKEYAEKPAIAKINIKGNCGCENKGE